MQTSASCRSLFLAITTTIGLVLSGCGSDGKDGATGPQGPAGESAVPPTELHMSITSASVNSAPVVNFTVTDQDGKGYAALADTDLRFNIAKLVPGQNGSSSTWQNYIVRGGESSEGSQERVRTGYPFGTLVNHGDGSYTYTFATDITDPNFQDTCPAPCSDVDGNALDISYKSGLTHRIAIQMGNSSLPLVDAAYDFVPAGGNPTLERDIVKTETCNQCHNQLRLHGTRIETKLCVTCHNPGSWVKDDPATITVDFKVMIHKIHMGADLPSVQAGGTYAIGNHDWSTVEFPADVRSAAGKNNANGGTVNRIACTKCHDPNDADTPQAVDYQTPKRAACGACHDDVDFTTGANHDGGVRLDDSECLQCHNSTTSGNLPGSVMKSHTLWDREYAQDCFQYHINVNSDPAPPNSTVSVTFAVTNPNPGMILGPDKSSDDPKCPSQATYDVLSDLEFGGTTDGTSRLGIDVGFYTKEDPSAGWDPIDYNNAHADDVGASEIPAKPIEIDALDPANVTAQGGGNFLVTTTIPAEAVGTGVAAIEGHAAVINPDSQPTPGARDLEAPIKGAVKYFGITDPAGGVPRREVVAIENCNNCHTWLSLHGSNRTEEPRLCVICHNPNQTDVETRPKDAGGVPNGDTIPMGATDCVAPDCKKEESLDFKRMIHGIHASGPEGFRENGLVVYGYMGFSVHEFGKTVHFPGLLQNCENCHVDDSYTLADRSDDDGANWEQPTQSGILASTIDTAPGADATTIAAQLLDQTDDLNMAPTAAVCSACHDDAPAVSHMAATGGAMVANTQAEIDTTYEACEVCHGPGKDFDLEVVHAWKR